MHGKNKLWVQFFHSFDRGLDDWFKYCAGEMKSAQHCVNGFNSRFFLQMCAHINDTGMRTSSDDYQATIFDMDAQCLIIIKRIGNPCRLKTVSE